MEVLVVEDSAPDQAYLVDAIRAIHGRANIVTAASKADALRSLEKQHFDLIFLDVVLPDDAEGGVEAARLARDTQPNAVVALTTSLDSDDHVIKKGLEWGAAMYIRKPFTDDEIEVAVLAAREVMHLT